MLGDFFIRAMLAGLVIASIAGPLGSTLLWRRMAYFSDATSHGAVLGVALAVILALPVLPAVFLCAAVLGLCVNQLTGRGYGSDTALIVLSYGALAVGLVALYLSGRANFSIEALLFGDILATSRQDLAVILVGAASVMAVMCWRWNRLLIATLSEDLAAASGVNPSHERLALTLVLALVVALALQVIGVLLVGALLIIPAAAARSIARTPEAMAVTASILAGISVVVGLLGSLHLDSPAGPSIVATAALIFLLCLPFRRFG